jgi:predicted transcriptional regulator
MTSREKEWTEDIIILLRSSRGAKSRRKITKLLLQRPNNCNQIAKSTNLEWWTVQKHLTILLNKNIITYSTVGRIRYYKINRIYEKTVDQINE